MPKSKARGRIEIALGVVYGAIIYGCFLGAAYKADPTLMSWQLNQPSEYAAPDQGSYQQGKAASQNHGSFGNLAVFIQLSTDISGFDEAEYTTPHGYRENERADRDLRAQEEMAKWAFWVMIFTASTVGVTFAGVVLIGFTLSETKRLRIEAEKTTGAALSAAQFSDDGAKATLKAAEAAIEANEIHRQSLIASNRAWVVPHDIAAREALTWRDDGAVMLSVLIKISNIGQTIATKMKWSAGMQSSTSGLTPDLSQLKTEFPNDLFPGSSVAPNEALTLTHVSGISSDNIAWFNIVDGETSVALYQDFFIHIVGRIIYSVHFDEVLHTTEFCYSVRPKEGHFQRGVDLEPDQLKFEKLSDGNLKID